jgi:hypothetical protein
MSDASTEVPASLAIGLQEWAVCCRALLDGRLALAVRKGGIHERGGGLFRLEHERFALLPTHLHQDPARLLPAFAGGCRPDPSPGAIAVAGWAEATRIWKIGDLARVQALGEELAWTPAELAARFAYRDQPWLHVVALRAWRLPAPRVIPDHPSYAGCRSWVPLREPIALAGSSPALGEAAFASRLERIAAVLGVPTLDVSAPRSGS